MTNSFAQVVSNMIMLSFVVGIPLYATCKKINAFETFLIGAKRGFETSLQILPSLIGLMVAIAMLGASGFFDALYHLLSPLLSFMGFPADLLPLALIRPFSGSTATGVMAEIIHNNGGDALISKMAATIMGSTETTFYVIAVYFGAVGITKVRHAIWAGLMADLAGIFASVYICRHLF